MSFKIKRSFDHEIEVSAQECAAIFGGLDSDEQAVFFNTLHEITQKWKLPFCMQLQYVTDSKELTNEGRKIMEEIGEYSNVRNQPQQASHDNI
jgi:hypothetical protein